MSTETESPKPSENSPEGEDLFAVWWLEEKDYHGFNPHQERNPLKLPDYVWRQFCDRYGRPGRGRLWVPEFIEIERLPVGEDHPNWSQYGKAGGIVIEAKDAAKCLLWGGRITTLELEPLKANA